MGTSTQGCLVMGACCICLQTQIRMNKTCTQGSGHAIFAGCNMASLYNELFHLQQQLFTGAEFESGKSVSNNFQEFTAAFCTLTCVLPQCLVCAFV